MQKVKRSRPPALTFRLYSAAPSARVVGEGPVAGDVDVLLRLLDPDAELERLRLEGDPSTQEHPVGIAGAVADRQDGEVGGDVARAGHQPLDPTLGDVEVLDPAGEPDLAPQLLELPAEGPDDQREAVRAQVRLGLVDDRRLAVAVGQDLQDPEDVGPGVPAGELAVAEGPRAPFAEEVVALGVEQATAVEPADVGDPVLHVPPSFEDQGAITVQGEQVAGEQTGRAGADDHRAMLQRIRAGLGPVEPFGRERPDRRPPRERGPIAGHLDLGRVDEVEVVVAPGVEALAQDPVGARSPRATPSRLGQLLGEDLLGLVEFQANVGDFPGHGWLLKTSQGVRCVWNWAGSGKWRARGRDHRFRCPQFEDDDSGQSAGPGRSRPG